jgi:hypothetical protein
MRESNDIGLQPHDIKDKAAVALRWLMEAKFKNVGDAYPDVVRLCLECSFRSVQPQSQRTLMNASFREAVYHSIVQRLEIIYETVTNPLKLSRHVD